MLHLVLGPFITAICVMCNESQNISIKKDSVLLTAKSTGVTVNGKTICATSQCVYDYYNA